MLEDEIKKKVTAILLVLVAIISMITTLAGCNEPKEFMENIIKSDFFVTFIVNIYGV